MRWYLVEVNCLLFKQQRLVLCLVVISTNSQCRFLTFPFISPFISNVIQSITYYSLASHIGLTYSLSNYFIRINMQEIFVQQHFFYVFFNVFGSKYKYIFYFIFFKYVSSLMDIYLL